MKHRVSIRRINGSEFDESLPRVTCRHDTNTADHGVEFASHVAFSYHRPADDFWRGFASQLLANGWTTDEVTALMQSTYIRHAWGDGKEADTVAKAGAVFALQFANRKTLGTVRGIVASNG